jgi:peptidoglycan hydrolase CwlO-like protein
MKLGCRVSLLVALSAFVASCGPSQADYDRAKRQLQLTQTERDNLKQQLDQATQKISTMQQQVQNLQAAATPKPDAADESKATAAKGSKKKAHAKARRTSKKKR